MLLASVPDPDQSLHHLERLRVENSAGFDRISNSPTALGYLITIFSYSNFLSEAVIRHPDWLLQLAVSGDLHRVLTTEEFEQRLTTFLESPGVPAAVDLARFRRQQLLRIVLRDVLGLASLSESPKNFQPGRRCAWTSPIAASEENWWSGTVRRGTRTRRRIEECGFAVIALGKLGGKELNYSSDIDSDVRLLGATARPTGRPISNKEFFKKVANLYTELLSTYTAGGHCATASISASARRPVR